MTDKKGCSERVYRTGGFGVSCCARRGVIEEDGKWWCKQHSPTQVKSKRKKQNAKWTLEGKISTLKYEILATQKNIVETTCRFVDGLTSADSLTAGVDLLRVKMADQTDMKQQLADMQKKK